LPVIVIIQFIILYYQFVTVCPKVVTLSEFHCAGFRVKQLNFNRNELITFSKPRTNQTQFLFLPEHEGWDEVVQLGWHDGLAEVSELEYEDLQLRNDQRRGGEEKLKTNKTIILVNSVVT
jgi:hypothetical protein